MSLTKTNLESELRSLIIHAANLTQMDPNDINPTAPLLKGGLGLDSIDLLELIVSLEQKYGLKLRNDDAGRQALSSLDALTAFTWNHLNGDGTEGSAATTSERPEVHHQSSP
jgi:acyl carrier protein